MEDQIIFNINRTNTWTSENNAAIRYCSANAYPKCVFFVLQHGGDVTVNNYSPIYRIREILSRNIDEKYKEYIFILAMLILYIPNILFFNSVLLDLKTYSASDPRLESVFIDVLEELMELIQNKDYLPTSDDAYSDPRKDILIREKQLLQIQRMMEQNEAIGAEVYRESPPTVSYL